MRVFDHDYQLPTGLNVVAAPSSDCLWRPDTFHIVSDTGAIAGNDLTDGRLSAVDIIPNAQARLDGDDNFECDPDDQDFDNICQDWTGDGTFRTKAQEITIDNFPHLVLLREKGIVQPECIFSGADVREDPIVYAGVHSSVNGGHNWIVEQPGQAEE